MSEFQLEEARRSRPMPRIPHSKEDLEGWRVELDAFYDLMDKFPLNEENVFHLLSAMSARASRIRSTVVRREDRAMQWFRTQELDPFLKECERQFKYWSRILTASQHEWEITTK